MTRSDAKRVSQRRPCLVCGRPDWCLYIGPDDAPTAAICARIESPKTAGSAGWWHRLRDDDRRPARAIRHPVRMVEPQDAGPVDFAKLAADCCVAVRPDDLQRLAGSLGLTVESLRRLRVGWASTQRAWSFPMTDAGGRILGVRLRLPSGRKLSVRGGKEGLFIPTELDAGARLLVCEGPTDTAALLDLGLAAVGRPSCAGGVRLLVELVRQQRPADVVIVADGDAPGQRGAENLAAVLVAYVPSVRAITPPVGIKDAREWKRRGATVADVAATIDAAAVRKLDIRSKAGRTSR